MGLQTGNTDPNPQHTLFCSIVGIPKDFDSTPYPSRWAVLTKKDKTLKGLYPRVKSAYQWHQFQYWLVATTANTFLLLQICFGAALTALGGTKTSEVSIAIIVLGALQSVFGGFLTYFKSRNQPNRSRQFRNGLAAVLQAIEDSESMLRDPAYVPPPYHPTSSNLGASNPHDQESWLAGGSGATLTGVEGMILRLMDMFCDTIRESDANYPDFWVSTKRTSDQEEELNVQDVLQQLQKTAYLQAPAAGVATGTSAPSIGMNSTTSVPVHTTGGATVPQGAATNTVSIPTGTTSTTAHTEKITV